MPIAPKRPCSYPGCATLVDSGRCAKHRQREREQRQQADVRRPSPAARGYDSKWRTARQGFLHHHPFCAECQRNGRVTPATVVDHIVPHKGDMRRFWDTSNWQPLCSACHSRKTAREDGGFGNREGGIKSL